MDWVKSILKMETIMRVDTSTACSTAKVNFI